MLNDALNKCEELKQVNDKIVELKRELRTGKIKYKISFLGKKYSDEYKVYKTIKEKEERAELEMLPLKEKLEELETELDSQRYKRDVLETEIDILLAIGDEE